MSVDDVNIAAPPTLKTCEMCCKEAAKYTCPACRKRTCSLACVNDHKQKFACSGSRDKTEFVAVNEFTNINLLNDYRFLEEVARVSDNAKRDQRKHGPGKRRNTR